MANSLTELYAAVASLDSTQRRIDESIESIVRSELHKDEATCMLALIGNFVVKATKSLSRLTDALVSGEHINANSADRMGEMKINDGFANWDYVSYMEKKHAILRDMDSEIKDTSDVIENLWKASPRTPSMPCRPPRQNSITLPSTPTAVKPCWDTESVHMVHLPRATSSPPTPDIVEFKNEMRSPGLEDDSQGIVNDLIADLASRGKGEYTCPLGNGCRKGGVLTSGDLLVFKRNSAFRTHLEKHGRRYKCDMPNCKNREGFARKDQLHRHQQETVAHGKGGT